MTSIFLKNIKRLLSIFTIFNSVLPRWYCDFNCFRWPNDFPLSIPKGYEQKNRKQKYEDRKIKIIFWLIIFLTEEKERAHAWHVYELNRSELEFEVWWHTKGKLWHLDKLVSY